MDNIHPVVRLLAKRMDSHPEEFGPDSGGRWAAWLDQLIPFVTEEERVMLRGPMMQDIHEEVMDELLNGDERRAKESRQREEAEQAYVQQQRAYLQQAAQPGRYFQSTAIGQQLGNANGYPYYNSITDTYEFGNGMKMTKAQIENNPGLVNSLKKALGL